MTWTWLPPKKSGTGLAGETISFYADGGAIGTAVTDDSGRATLTVPKPYHAGHHSFAAEFAGDDRHSASSGQAES